MTSDDFDDDSGPTSGRQSNLNANSVAGAPFTLAAGEEVTGVHIVRQWWIADPLRYFWSAAVGGIAGSALPIVQYAKGLLVSASATNLSQKFSGMSPRLAGTNACS